LWKWGITWSAMGKSLALRGGKIRLNIAINEANS
jgi:hypothetical protein